MRAYSIAIRNPTTGQVVQAASLKGTSVPSSLGIGVASPNAYPFPDATWKSFFGTPANPNIIPGALNIEFDLWNFQQADPAGSSWVRVWGISLSELASVQTLAGYEMNISGGMVRGLPLSRPAQYGPIVGGVINQAFGNWEGLQQTVDFYLRSDTSSVYAPKNIVLNWPANTPLSAAVNSTLSVAFPDHIPSVTISANLVQSRDDAGRWSDISSFAKWLKEKSLSILGSTNGYYGVEIWFKPGGKVIHVYDTTSPGNPATPSQQDKPTTIQFADMIGQPLIISPGLVTFKTALRADIQVSDFIFLQPNVAQVQNTSNLGFQQSNGQNQINSNFAVAGTYQITNVRHMGNFRQADASAWVTVFQATIVSPAFNTNATGQLNLGPN